jgi:hypothetical protein
MFGENPRQHITEYHSPYFQASWWLDHIMCMLVIVKDWGVFFRIKRNGIELKHRQNPRGNPGSVCFPPDIGRLFNNNRKPKAKSTLELLTKKTVNVPDWPSYSFDLKKKIGFRIYGKTCKCLSYCFDCNLLENLWQDLKMVVKQ